MIESLKHEVDIGELTRKANVDDVIDKVNELIDVVNLMIEQTEKNI